MTSSCKQTTLLCCELGTHVSDSFLSFAICSSVDLHVGLCVNIDACGGQRCGNPGAGIVWASQHGCWEQNFILFKNCYALICRTIASHGTNIFTFYCINILVRYNMVSDILKAPGFTINTAFHSINEDCDNQCREQCPSASVEENSCCIALCCRRVLSQTD